MITTRIPFSRVARVTLTSLGPASLRPASCAEASPKPPDTKIKNATLTTETIDRAIKPPRKCAPSPALGCSPTTPAMSNGRDPKRPPPPPRRVPPPPPPPPPATVCLPHEPPRQAPRHSERSKPTFSSPFAPDGSAGRMGRLAQGGISLEPHELLAFTSQKVAEKVL